MGLIQPNEDKVLSAEKGLLKKKKMEPKDMKWRISHMLPQKNGT